MEFIPHTKQTKDFVTLLDLYYRNLLMQPDAATISYYFRTNATNVDI